jgi:hypothetical protein
MLFKLLPQRRLQLLPQAMLRVLDEMRTIDWAVWLADVDACCCKRNPQLIKAFNQAGVEGEIAYLDKVV